MTTPTRLQFTSVRTRQVGEQVLIGLKHTYKNSNGHQFKTEWIEMTPEDAVKLARTLQGAVGEGQGSRK